MDNSIRARRLAELLGLEPPKIETPQQIQAKDDKSREAEAVLAYANDHLGFIERFCKRCGKVFAVNRKCIGYCGDDCRADQLRDMGIDWDPTGHSPTDRWSMQTAGREPLTVPPTALVLVQQLAQNQTIEGDAVAG